MEQTTEQQWNKNQNQNKHKHQNQNHNQIATQNESLLPSLKHTTKARTIKTNVPHCFFQCNVFIVVVGRVQSDTCLTTVGFFFVVGIGIGLLVVVVFLFLQKQIPC
jgi:hypothetical protein